jgi:hypothetical protein
MQQLPDRRAGVEEVAEMATGYMVSVLPDRKVRLGAEVQEISTHPGCYALRLVEYDEYGQRDTLVTFHVTLEQARQIRDGLARAILGALPLDRSPAPEVEGAPV